MIYQMLSTVRVFGTMVKAVGYASDSRVTRFGPARRSTTIIHYVLTGSGFYNGTRLGRGEGFIIRPGDPEEYYPDPGDPWSFVWFILDSPDPESFLRYYGEDARTHTFRYDFTDILCSVRDETLSKYDKPVADYRLETMSLFLRVLRHHEAAAVRPEDNAEVYAEYARNCMDIQYFGNVTVSEIADRIGISAPYLFKIFKQRYGVSPKQYLSGLRLEQAKYYLLSTNLSVSEVGKAVGYENVLAFSHFFSAKCGMPPSEYRLEAKRFRDETES